MNTGAEKTKLSLTVQKWDFFETLCNYIHSCVSAITLRLFDAIPSYAWKWAAETAKTHIANADLSAIVCGATNNVLLLLVSMTDVRADN